MTDKPDANILYDDCLFATRPTERSEVPHRPPKSTLRPAHLGKVDQLMSRSQLSATSMETLNRDRRRQGGY